MVAAAAVVHIVKNLSQCFETAKPEKERSPPPLIVRAPSAVCPSCLSQYSSHRKFRISPSRNLCKKWLDSWEATASFSFCIIRWWSVGLSDFGQPKIVCGVLAFHQLIIIACLITRESANMERLNKMHSVETSLKIIGFHRHNNNFISLILP